MKRMSAGRFGAVAISLILAAPVAATFGPSASASPQEKPVTQQTGHWVSAWTSSMQGPNTLKGFGIETLSGTQQEKLLHSIVPPQSAFDDETIRQVMYLHHGGNQVRIRLSNQFGTSTTRFPSVTTGIRQGDNGATMKAGTQRTVTFGGKRSVSIPVGKTVLSDPVSLPTRTFDHLILSIFVPKGNGPATVHGNAMQTYFVGSGNKTTSGSDAGFVEHGFKSSRMTDLVPHLLGNLTTAGYYASGVEVKTDSKARTLVAFGDSITDGYMSTVNTNSRYPDYLARRLQANPGTRCLSVANQAISGGRVTGEGFGPSALQRLPYEVLNQPNIAGVILNQGINDLGTAVLQGLPVDADKLIAAYKTFAQRAHARGVKVYMSTLIPAGNLLRPVFYGLYSSPIAVAARHKINDWVRSEGSKYFDGVIDYDKAVKDPLIEDWINTLKYDSLDNLHPNDAGYKKMADTVPLKAMSALCK